MTTVPWTAVLFFILTPLIRGECSLCEDGSLPPDLDFVIKQTCGELVNLVSTEPSGERCTAAQATYGVYCGCSNPVASSRACRVCGEDLLLPDPGLVVITDTFSNDCINLEYMAVGKTEGISCDQAQTISAATICCNAPPGPVAGDSSPPPPDATTNMPSAAPSALTVTTPPPAAITSQEPTLNPTGMQSVTQTDPAPTTVTLEDFSLTITAQDLDRVELKSTIASHLFTEMQAEYSNLKDIVLEEDNGRRQLQQTIIIAYSGVANFNGTSPPANEVVAKQKTALEDTAAVQMALDVNPAIGIDSVIDISIIGDEGSPLTLTPVTSEGAKVNVAWPFLCIVVAIML